MVMRYMFHPVGFCQNRCLFGFGLEFEQQSKKIYCVENLSELIRYCSHIKDNTVDNCDLRVFLFSAALSFISVLLLTFPCDSLPMSVIAKSLQLCYTPCCSTRVANVD